MSKYSKYSGMLGRIKTAKKAAASRRNGKLGGRPKKRWLPQSHKRTAADEIKTFWSRVDIKGKDECWDWMGGVISRKKYPYGAFLFNGERRPAHKVAYEITYGAMPTFKIACHTCDNPKCCNPGHVYPGTHQSNMDDRKNRGRENRAYGTRYSTAKLTDDSVRQIRSMYAGGGITHRQLAARFGVSGPRICKVLKGYIRKHVMQ